jgi:hypothetical protein
MGSFMRSLIALAARLGDRRRQIALRSARFATLAALSATMVHCSSKQGTSGSGVGVIGTAQDQTDGGAPLYPTSNIGTAQRGLDANGNPNATPGDVIADFKFLGYPNADSASGLQTISLADYYDPTASKHKILHIIAAAAWCTPCVQETTTLLTDLATPATDFEAEGVVYLQALIEGTTENVGATQTDLNTWISQLHPTFSEVLDPEGVTLGVFFDAAAVPFNADIDLRSMEVLQAGTGYEDPAAVKVWIDWVNENPPAYSSQ